MNSLTRKTSSILPALEERGAVYLYALAEREDVDRWDVILSSEWSDKDWPGSIGIVVDLLWPVLEQQEKISISRIAIVPSGDARMRDLPDSLDGVAPEDQKVIYVSLLGENVRRAYIFKAQHAPSASVRESVPDVAVLHF